MVASQGGKKLPEGAGHARRRTPTDPAEALRSPRRGRAARRDEGQGAIRAFGERLGLGLRLHVRNSRRLADRRQATGPSRRFCNGMFSMYVDPKRIDRSRLRRRCRAFIGYFKVGEAAKA